MTPPPPARFPGYSGGWWSFFPDAPFPPQELKFTLAVTKMKGYFEAFFEQPPPFKLSLVDVCTEETVWSATIRDGTTRSALAWEPGGGACPDACFPLLVFFFQETAWTTRRRGRGKGRLVSSFYRRFRHVSRSCRLLLSPLKPDRGAAVPPRESWLTKDPISRTRRVTLRSLTPPIWRNAGMTAALRVFPPDGPRTEAGQGQRDLSDKQLLQVAKQLGRVWKQVAIYLDLDSKDLEDIQAAEKDVTMQKLQMLVKWKGRQPPGKAAAFHLLQSVRDLDELPNEVHKLLEGNVPHSFWPQKATTTTR